jgi:hypothetical protein
MPVDRAGTETVLDGAPDANVVVVVLALGMEDVDDRDRLALLLYTES